MTDIVMTEAATTSPSAEHLAQAEALARELFDMLELEFEQLKAQNLDAFEASQSTKNDLLQQWEACADRLFVYAMETLSTATNMALYEVAKEDVLVYNRLKNGNE